MLASNSLGGGRGGRRRQRQCLSHQGNREHTRQCLCHERSGTTKATAASQATKAEKTRGRRRVVVHRPESDRSDFLSTALFSQPRWSENVRLVGKRLGNGCPGPGRKGPGRGSEWSKEWQRKGQGRGSEWSRKRRVQITGGERAPTGSQSARSPARPAPPRRRRGRRPCPSRSP